MKKTRNWIYGICVILCLIFTAYRAVQTTENTRTDQYGTSTDGTVSLDEAEMITCTFALSEDNFRGVSVKFQAEEPFDKELLKAVLVDEDTSEILAEDTVELKNERIQNKDGGSYIYFSLPIEETKGRTVRLEFSLGGDDIRVYPAFVTSNKKINDAVLSADGVEEEQNLVFSTRYYLGETNNIVSAVSTGLLLFLLVTMIFLWGRSREQADETVGTWADRVLEKLSLGWKRISSFLSQHGKVLGYLLLAVGMLFVMVYVYQYAVEAAMSEYGMPFLKKMYAVLCGLLFLAGSVCYYFIFVKPVAVERIFVVMALGLGIIFGLVIGVDTVPDEPSHIDTAYRISNEILGVEESDKPGYIYKRACDVDLFAEDRQSLGAESYQWLYEEFFKPAGDTTLVECAARSNLGNASRIYYLPQALGLTIGRLAGLGMMQTMLLGRLLSLLFYIGITFVAIRKLPFAKTTLTLIACLPISLQQAASFSYDAMINAVAFLYVSYCLYAVYSENRIRVLEIAVLAVTGSMLATVKGGVYIPVCFLPLLIFFVKRKGYTKRKKYLFAASAISLLAFISQNLEKVIGRFTADPGTVIGGSQSSEIYTFSYLLQYPHRFIGMFVNTVFKQGDAYLRNLLGGNLAWREVNISWFLVVGFLIVLLFSCISHENKTEIKATDKVYMGVLSFGSYFCIELSMMLVWTPTTINYITGVQGRYFLPFFLLILLVLRNSFFNIRKKIDSGLIFAFAVLNILTLLQVLQRVL